jgi:hypothetical protein
MDYKIKYKKYKIKNIKLLEKLNLILNELKKNYYKKNKLIIIIISYFF